MQTKFIDKGLKAHKLYANTPLFKAVLLVAIPGLLISLMSGIYVFADQLLLTLLVPKDSMHNFDSIYGSYSFNVPTGMSLQEYIESLISEFNENTGRNYVIADTSSIVKSSVAITLPIMNVINAVPNVAAIGAGSMYGQCIARNNKPKATQIWKSTFYCAIAIGVLSSIIAFSFNNIILETLAGNTPNFDSGLDNTKLEDLNAYFLIAHNTQIEWSHQFLDILSWSSILNVFILYFSFMVRAEGKLWFVTSAEIVCNLLNILFDFIYISLCHQGMKGGGYATLTGWGLNVFVYATYIWYLSKKNETWMKYGDLLPNNGNKMCYSILVPILIIGLSVFLRNFTNSIANAAFLPFLHSVAEKSNQSGQHWEELSGAVWPVTSLFFFAIFGIADGIRTLVSYNYGRGNFNRIKKTYWYAIFISMIYAIIVYICLATWLGSILISLFHLPPATATEAINYLTIQAIFIPMVALSIGGLLMFQGTNQMAMANFIAVFQGCLTFPISVAIMYFTAISYSDPLLFVITNPLNTGMAGIVVSIISIVYLKRFLGKARIHTVVRVNNSKNELVKKKITMVIPATFKKISYAEKELIRSIKN